MQIQEQTRPSFVERANKLRMEFLRLQDQRAVQQVDDLTERQQNPAVLVALVGLFSAGKSTLVNALCQSELATGAVPTTATVHEVTLPKAGGQVHLLDTPGVDSTDDSHRQATEDALYQADVVLLVMDYQHVEADENLELASMFASGAKRLVLVVNQVDKHLDFELPFDVFQARIESSLQDWDIHYERLFYTSTRPSTHSQLAELQAWLTGLASSAASESSDADAAETASGYMERLREVIAEHVARRFAPQVEARIAAAADDFEPELLSDAQARSQYLQILLQQQSDLAESLAAGEQAVADEAAALRERFTRMVNMAQIAPYDTTERGRHYVESLRSSFRVGWLGSQAKTEAERNRRLQEFLADLNQRTEHFLAWAVQGELRTAIQSLETLPAEWVSRVDELTVSATPELCRGLLNRGALESEQYPYQFVKDVVARVKGQFTSRLNTFLDDLMEAAELQRRAGAEEHMQQLSQLESAISKLQAFSDLEQAQRAETHRLKAMLESEE